MLRIVVHVAGTCVHMAIEARRLHALVGFDQVRPGLAVGYGAVQTSRLPHRQIRDSALPGGVRQRAPLQLAPSQRLPIEIQSPSRLCVLAVRDRHAPCYHRYMQ